MRDRHFPRLCRSCSRPMARQEDGCWQCGAAWAADPQPRPALKAADASAEPDWSDEGGAIAAVAAR
jgi:predicted amidophosphoribosyltransferase